MVQVKICVNTNFYVCVLFASVGVQGYITEWEALTEGILADLCPVLATITSSINDLFSTHSIDDDEGPISSELITESLKCGRTLSRAADERAEQLVKSGVNLQPYPGVVAGFFSPVLSADLKKASRASHEILAATKLLQMKMCTGSDVTPNTFMSFLEHQVIQLSDLSYCKPLHISCISSRYRSLDGSCNNLRRPGWGRKNAPYTRIAKPRYADGIHAMPVSVSGGPLPGARLLSARLFPDRAAPSRVLTHMNMQWGQFITHDLSSQVMETTDEGGIQCCVGEGENELPAEWENNKCIPIGIPKGDPFYSRFGVKCLNFVRSVTVPRDDCSLGHAEQVNTVTSFLDGSPIYGSGGLSQRLRTKSGGKLRSEKRKHGIRGYLPTVKDKAVCDLRNGSGPCYLAGDDRINQTPTLALLHTLFLREHNRVAEILGSLNPLWSDEKLYQEARRVVVAEIQHITYQEWLPLNLGENYIRYYRISPSSLYSHDYNPEVNPGIINSFTTAAFRFLHSIVPDSIVTCSGNYQDAHRHRLSDHYANPSLLEETPDSFDDAVRGILLQSSWESDPYVTSEVSNYLFKSSNKWGFDLIAMDIQRGRDHGIASYNDFRELCGLRKANTFQDLAGEISQDRINALSHLYEHVDDIDLFVGGTLERAVPGSILGHTFQCIVAEQFYRTRIGDRFFYDNSEMAHSFTADQLAEIKKASLARLICDNTDGVYWAQRRGFELESPYNPRRRCDDFAAIPRLDFTPWQKPLFDIFD